MPTAPDIPQSAFGGYLATIVIATKFDSTRPVLEPIDQLAPPFRQDVRTDRLIGTNASTSRRESAQIDGFRADGRGFFPPHCLIRMRAAALNPKARSCAETHPMAAIEGRAPHGCRRSRSGLGVGQNPALIVSGRPKGGQHLVWWLCSRSNAGEDSSRTLIGG